MNKAVAGVCGALCFLALAGCDDTYTPSAHHQVDASTGSRLQGTDTGADASGSTGDPSISTTGHSGGGR